MASNCLPLHQVVLKWFPNTCLCPHELDKCHMFYVEQHPNNLNIPKPHTLVCITLSLSLSWTKEWEIAHFFVFSHFLTSWFCMKTQFCSNMIKNCLNEHVCFHIKYGSNLTCLHVWINLGRLSSPTIPARNDTWRYNSHSSQSIDFDRKN